MKILTHYDLDGMTSLIVFRCKYLKEINDSFLLENTIFTTYKNIDKVIESLKNKKLFIFDLNLNLDQLKVLINNKNKIIYLVDHHYTNYNNSTFDFLNENDILYSIDEEKSASLLIYEKLFGNKKKDGLYDLVKYTNIYDLFKTNDNGFLISERLNSLFWFYKENFFNRFKDGFFGFSLEDEKIINFLEEKEENILKKIKDSAIEYYINNIKILIVYIESFNDFSIVNKIPSYFKSDISFIIKPLKDNNEKIELSLRINKDLGINIDDLKNCFSEEDKVLSINGHRYAGGMTIKKDINIKKLFEKAFLNLKKLNSKKTYKGEKHNEK